MNNALQIWQRPMGELHGDETAQDKTLADLHKEQQRRQDALADAATYHDDPVLVEMLFDEVTGGQFHDAFLRLCQDVLETSSNDNVMVRPEFVRAVEGIAIRRFGGSHD